MPHYQVYEKLVYTFAYKVEADNATEAALAIEGMMGEGDIIDEYPMSVLVEEYTPSPPFDPNQLDIFMEK